MSRPYAVLSEQNVYFPATPYSCTQQWLGVLCTLNKSISPAKDYVGDVSAERLHQLGGLKERYQLDALLILYKLIRLLLLLCRQLQWHSSCSPSSYPQLVVIM